MFDIDRWQEIWQTITRNRWRSFFTTMGIFGGIIILIIMSGISNGMQRIIWENTYRTVNSAIFYPQKITMPYKGFNPDRTWLFTKDDIEILKKNIPKIQHITGIVTARITTASYNDKSGNYYIMGFTPEQQKIEQYKLLYGRTINQTDIISKRKVCILGERAYRELFSKKQNPIGKNIDLGGTIYSVIGVYATSSNFNLTNTDNYIVMPSSTLQECYNMGEQYNQLVVNVNNSTNITQIETQIRPILFSRHNIAPNDTKALKIFNLKTAIDSILNLYSGIKFLSWLVGIGTLFAGLIGISNILLVVVKERTQEIGIRKALGASPFSILSQILTESFFLTIIAGIMGFLAGVGILTLIDLLLHNSGDPVLEKASLQIPFITAIKIILSISFCGILAGMPPALKAIHANTINAIREE